MNTYRIFFYIVAGVYAVILLIAIPRQGSAQGKASAQPQESEFFYTIQVCSFAKKNNAERLLSRLNKKGYASFIREGKKDNTATYRVFIGHYSTKAEAETKAAAFYKKEKIAYIITNTGSASLATQHTYAEAEPPANPRQLEPIVQKKNKASAKSLHNGVTADKTAEHAKKMLSSLYEELPYRLYLEAEPSFSWQLYYEDRTAASTRTDKRGDFSNRYKPEFMVNIKANTFTLSAQAQLKITEYLHEREWNTVDQDYVVSAIYNSNPRSVFSLLGQYSVNTDPNRYFKTDSEDIGSVALEGSYYVEKYRTKTTLGGATYSFEISPRRTINMNLTYSNFDTGGSDSSGFYLGSFGYNYNLTKKTDLSFTYDFSYLYYEAGGGDTQFIEDLISGGDYDVFFGSDFKSTTNTLSGKIGHEFSNDSKIDLSLGWSHNYQKIKTETTDNATGEKISDTTKTRGDSVTCQLTYEKRFTDTKIQFNIQQQTGTNANSDASFASRTLTAKAFQDFNQRLRGNLSLAYDIYHSDEDSFGFEIDEHILYITTSLTYKWTRWISLSGGYSYYKNHDKILHYSTERNTLYLTLNFRPLRPYGIR